MFRATANEVALQATAESEGDQELLERFVTAGDASAFARLVERHGGLVWSVCRRLLAGEQDAEDAFQAVFVVLARNASSIRKREAVGSWLYGVAYRIAMRLRKTTARRRERLQQAASASLSGNVADGAPPSEAAFRELQRLLDEELQKLPEKYRAPFVLCCLEGLSKIEAARELGLKEGTVGSRVHHARKLLESRLARRGVTLAALLTAAALGQASTLAAPPAALLQTTSQAAGATNSPSAAELAARFLHVAELTRRLRLTVFVALAALLMGVGLATYDLLDRPTEEVLVADTFLAPPAVLGTPVDERVQALVFSRDGQKLVTAGGGEKLPGQLKVWDIGAARELVSLDRIPSVHAAVLAADEKAVITGDRDGRVCWRDLETGEERASLNAHAGAVLSLVLRKQGDLLASGGADAQVKVWDARGLGKPQVFLGHGDRVQSVAFFHHRQAIVSGSRDETARIWDISTGKEVLQLPCKGDANLAVAVSPDDKLIATASGNAIRLWDAENGAEVAPLTSGPSPLVRRGEKGAARTFLHVAFSPDGQLLAGAGADGAIQIWSVATLQPVATLEKHAEPALALVFSRDGKQLASGSADKTAKVWPIGENGRAGPPTTLDTRWSGIRPISALAYAPDGHAFAVATKDQTLHVRDAESGDVQVVMNGHKGAVTCVAFAPGGRTIASGSRDCTIQLWERSTGANLGVLTGHPGGVLALAFSADGRTLMSAGADKMIRMWDLSREKQLAVLEGHQAPVLALAVGREGRFASSDADGIIKIWDATEKIEVRTLSGHRGAVHALAFASDGTLASGGDDAAVKVWPPGASTPRHTLKRHTGAILTLAFAPGDRALVSGGQDATVVVWDPVTGESRSILKGHGAAVTALAMHPLGRHLISGSDDTRLLRWQAKATAAAR